MKAYCVKSGLEFETSFLSDMKTNKHSKVSNTVHPIFSMAASEVIKQVPAGAYAGFLAQQDLHLLGTFFLSKLPVQRWEAPLLSETYGLDYWCAVWLKNMEQLMKVSLMLENKSWRRICQFNLSSAEGEPCGNLNDWLQETTLTLRELTQPISDEARKLNKQYAANIRESESVLYSEAHCEEIVQKGLRGSLLSAKETKEYPALVARWARKVGEFPTARVTLASGKKVSLADFWEDILVKGFKLDGSGLIDLLVSDVTVGDIEELLEHCSVTIIQDNSVMSMSFFRELAVIAESLAEFRNPAPSKRTITSSNSADLLSLLGDAGVSNNDNLKSFRQTDEHSPKREDYNSMREYLAARKVYAASKAGGDTDATADSIVSL